MAKDWNVFVDYFKVFGGHIESKISLVNILC